MAAPLNISKEFVKTFFTTETIEDRPVQWEIALHTGSPDTGDANEVEGLTYVRQDVSFESYLEDGGKFYEAQSVNDVKFPKADSADSYTVTHYTIRDKTNGEALAVAKLAVPIPVGSGTEIIFPSNYIKVRGV